MRYEIVVEDDSGLADEPWSAGVFPISSDGESGDLVAGGVGRTPVEAVASAVDEWKRVLA